MSLQPERAIAKRTVAGRTIYLCSPACTAKFDRDPAAFVGDAASPSHGHGHGRGGCC